MPELIEQVSEINLENLENLENFSDSLNYVPENSNKIGSKIKFLVIFSYIITIMLIMTYSFVFVSNSIDFGLKNIKISLNNKEDLIPYYYPSTFGCGENYILQNKICYIKFYENFTISEQFLNKFGTSFYYEGNHVWKWNYCNEQESSILEIFSLALVFSFISAISFHLLLMMEHKDIAIYFVVYFISQVILIPVVQESVLSAQNWVNEDYKNFINCNSNWNEMFELQNNFVLKPFPTFFVSSAVFFCMAVFALEKD